MGLTVTFELECVNDMDTVSALLLSEGQTALKAISLLLLTHEVILINLRQSTRL